jgi:hypothetical protein
MSDDPPDELAFDPGHEPGRRPNMLIVVGDGEIEPVVHRVLATSAQPVVTSLLPGRLLLPDVNHATILLLNVTALSRPQQEELFEWLGRGTPGQVVSLEAGDLWPAVQRGDFSTALYYRLNVVCVSDVVAAPGAEDPPARHVA